MIALCASNDFKSVPVEELVGTLKVHELELMEDEGQRKGKFISSKVQKALKRSLSRENGYLQAK